MKTDVWIATLVGISQQAARKCNCIMLDVGAGMVRMKHDVACRDHRRQRSVATCQREFALLHALL